MQHRLDARKERLNTLKQQRQELDQASQRLSFWYEDKQRLLAPDEMIPLKASEIERMQKKFNVKAILSHARHCFISFQDTLNELKFQRITLDSIVKLGDEVKQGYAHEEQHEVDLQMDGTLLGCFELQDRFCVDLLRKLNTLEDAINNRNRQLNGATEQRREFDRLVNQFHEWIKTTEQQVKEHLTHELQQTTDGLKDKYRSTQVRF